MLSKGELHKLAVKKREWDGNMRGFDGWWKRVKRLFHRESKNMIDWYLFYKPKDTTDKIWHLMLVILVDLIALRVFGLI